MEAAVPVQYAGYTSLGLIGLMMLGRCIKALQNGSGIKGWFTAVWCGTNTPKILIACLCLLTLPSCQNPADTARLGSLANISITYAARHGVLTDADVEALRAANEIILPPVRPEMTKSGK